MKVSSTSTAYDDWRGAVDERLRKIYCLSIEDAGFDEGYLVHHWSSNELPNEFVEWFGNKHGLGPLELSIRLHDRGR